MLDEIVIKNFKSHQDTSIQLNNLTILTGMNCSGKTSVIQALLLLRQSYLKGRLMDGLDLNKPLCNIGVGNDALYRHASFGEISFEIRHSGELFSFTFDAGFSALSDSFLSKKLYSNNIENGKLAEIPLFNNEFQYVSASRWGGRSIFPKETYSAETQRQISLDNGQGELVAQYLYKFGSQDVYDYSKGDETDLSLLNQTIYWEQKISPNVKIDVELGKDNNSFSVLYAYNGVNGQKPVNDLRAENIGYGISYTLPVVVALLSARPGALVIIENPEAHLHPAGQSELAKLITAVAEHGVQVIVETHSDHIVTGVQLACKDNTLNSENGINKENVSIYHSYNSEGQASKMEKVEIKDNGKLEYQPKGFFDQAELDMLKLFD